jgi:hypothetical protein
MPALSTQNTTENNCVISHAQSTTAPQPHYIFIRHTLVSGHKQENTGFLQRNFISRSTTDSSVSNSTDTINKLRPTKPGWERSKGLILDDDDDDDNQQYATNLILSSQLWYVFSS